MCSIKRGCKDGLSWAGFGCCRLVLEKGGKGDESSWNDPIVSVMSNMYGLLRTQEMIALPSDIRHISTKLAP